METYLPYIVTIITALISGFASYFASRRQSKADLEQLMKKHELDLEKEKELFLIEKEKMEIEHRHQLELLQKEAENNINAAFANTLVTEALKMPEIRNQLSAGVKNSVKKKNK